MRVVNGGSFFRDRTLSDWTAPDFDATRWYSTSENNWSCPPDAKGEASQDCGSQSENTYTVKAQQAYNGDRGWKYGGYIQFAIGYEFEFGGDYFMGMSDIKSIKMISGAVSIAAGLSTAALASIMF